MPTFSSRYLSDGGKIDSGNILPAITMLWPVHYPGNVPDPPIPLIRSFTGTGILRKDWILENL